MPQDLLVLADGDAGIHLHRLDDEWEQLPLVDPRVGLEDGVSGRDALAGIGPVVDTTESFQVTSVRLGQVGQIGDDQCVFLHQRGRVTQ
ncbi:MAG TPA: hypothetical protein VHR66_05745, partial [Gemmataceae bacterium]|nr:hypothetical protein [Gemmataceae bacterium]